MGALRFERILRRITLINKKWQPTDLDLAAILSIVHPSNRVSGQIEDIPDFAQHIVRHVGFLDEFFYSGF